eukprot:TRINITY_DN1955_c0_g4_i1.p1 TRINITY_DN1955_c0_g4~~TRINITY_DN1955_c0_g4_i1.p1  ORF type:complete len:250 (+),score=24.39 TRINITY_DN1955_c0_g4_i1:35-784(+)
MPTSPGAKMLIVSALELLGIASVVASLGNVHMTILASPVVVASLLRTCALVVRVCAPWHMRNFEPRALALWNACLTAVVSVYLGCVFSTAHLADWAHSTTLGCLLLAKIGVIVVDALANILCAAYAVCRTLPQDTVQGPSLDEHWSLDDFALCTRVWKPTDEAKDGTGNYEAEGTCCICLRAFDVDDIITDLMCKHVFHRGCIKDWVESQHISQSDLICPLRCNLKARTILAPLDLGRVWQQKVNLESD